MVIRNLFFYFEKNKHVVQNMYIHLNISECFRIYGCLVVVEVLVVVVVVVVVYCLKVVST